MYLKTVFYIYLCLSLSTSTEAVDACPDGWERYGGSCYHVRYSVEGVGWEGAAKYCDSLGASLPVIATPIENNKLYTMIIELGRRLNLDSDAQVFTWLGYHNTDGERWRWIETGKVSTYENFNSDVLRDPEPDTSKCAAVFLYGEDIGKWDDLDCQFASLLRFIACERIVEPKIRLAGGRNDLEGRVEIKIGNRWGTVCDDFWTDENSHVVCRQLGYPMSEYFRPGSPSNAGSGTIWLDDVKCTGEERFLTSCQQAEFGTSDCKHNEDVWIKCYKESQRKNAIPKWFSATNKCYDWDARCDNGNCYSVCSDQSLVQEIIPHRLRVTTSHTDLSALDQYIPDGYNTVNNMELFSQNAIVNQMFTPNFHLQVMTRRLQLENTAILSYDDVTKCYQFHILTHEGTVYYVFSGSLRGYSVAIYAETLHIPSSFCLHLIRSPLANIPTVPAEYTALSITCVGVQSLSVSRGNNDDCAKNMMLDTISFIINLGPSKEILEWVISIKSKILVRVENEVRFVPSLSHRSYESLLRTYQNDLELLADGLQNFLDKDTRFDEKIEILELFRSNAKDVLAARELEYTNGLNEIAVSKKTIELLQKEFNALQPKLENVRRKFESDVKSYAIRKSFQAFFSLVEGIANVFGKAKKDEEDVSVKDIFKVVGLGFLDILNLIFTITKLFKTIDNVDSYIDGKSNPSSQELESYITSMHELSNLQLTVLTWQSLENAADGLLSQGKVTEIPSAGEYRQIVSDVADYGRALTEEMIRHTQLLLQKIEDMQWLNVSRNEAERLEDVIQKAKEQQINLHFIFSELDFQIYFIKYSVKDTVNTFCKSKFYYQFYECDVASLPVMSDSIRLVRQKIGSLLRSQLLGLVKFSYGRTQPIIITKKLRDKKDCSRRGKYANIADCPVLSFKRKNVVYFFIGLNSTEFLELYRVRIEKVRIYLNGDIGKNKEGSGWDGRLFVEEGKNKKVRLDIQTTGVFYDRHGTQNFGFTGIQVNKKFEYRIGNRETPILDGDIYSAEANSFVNTTPFTTWCIRAPVDKNAHLNLDNLSSIEIHFFGTAVVGY
ncbi:uncharacterized protein LOC117122127 [Anneissia japonica]|uniref:uncharacterized protein LOC117122127 n=1 Tax=Anneissia japonica TaxID=1529436 RepID=UPI001425B377|nr:uncharacterized protein LOC117122127 [Anneissia japonica]